MSSSEIPGAVYAPYRDILLQTARASIRHGLEQGCPKEPQVPPGPLAEPGACFVTLELDGRLRGCIGSLEPRRPLLQDVAVNAFEAAFRDPRFPPLREDESARLHLHLSVLHPPRPVACDSEAALQRRLRPGIDGLILAAQGRRATFLPSVWDALPDPVVFLRELKLKAGLSAEHWSCDMQAWTYTVEMIA